MERKHVGATNIEEGRSGVSMKKMVGVYYLKVFIAILFLATFVYMFKQYNRNLVEVKQMLNPIHMQRDTTNAPMPHDFCTFTPLSPADALEESLILDSIAWPETPLLPAPLSLEKSSDPAHSTFTIQPGRGGGEWHVGDELEVLIKVCDFKGHAKKTGGDFLVARLHSVSLGAGVAGRVVDHLNGSYSAVFPLLWEGNAQVEVTFVHSSEAVTVLHRLTKEHPDRYLCQAVFQSGSLSETTSCNVCLRQTGQQQCNFTDLRTGEPWFCYKPKNLGCDTWVVSSRGKFTQDLKDGEEKLFQVNVNMKVKMKASGPDIVPVLPPKKGQTGINENRGKSEVSGFYYQSVWRALDGTRVQQFSNSSAMTQCLKRKFIHLYGDSTIRQWFEYLDASLPDVKQFDLKSPSKRGPWMMLDNANKIMITYRCHGHPLFFTPVPVSQLRYIANELDLLRGGPDTVVVIGIWAHFTTVPVELYIRRLQNIRRAVLRLLARAPGTLVVIRRGNLRDVTTLFRSVMTSDWFSSQRDKVLRAIFKGVNVRLVDAWEMVQAHHLPHNVHPPLPIIKNMINVLLSYICPRK